MGVSYRKRGNKWHIRFREKGKKEVTEVLPGSLHESTIEKRVGWWEQEIALGREDPWREERDGVLVDLVDEYLKVNLESGYWSEATHKGNESVLNRLIKPVREKRFSEVDFQKLYEGLAGTAQTKRSDRTRVNAFLSYYHKKGFQKRQVEMPTKAAIELRNDDSIKYLTWRQVEDICNAYRFLARQRKALVGGGNAKSKDLYPDMWWFMFYALIRKEEVPKLKVSDLTGNKLRVHSKGRRVDTITLPPPALEAAQRQAKNKSPDDPLFTGHMGRATHHLREAVILSLGEDHPKGFHQLRHGGVVHYFSLGKPIQFISKLARHKSIQVTLKVYADVLPDSMEQVFSDVTHAPPD